MQAVPVYVPIRSQGQEWREKFPSGMATFIGLVQMFLTLGILACETISMINGFEHGFLFIGYGTSNFFIIAWISVYGSLCCGGRGCATYTLVMEILCFCFSVVLLAFDIIFLQDPFKCFFTVTTNYCNLLSINNSSSLWSFDGSYLSITKNKVPAIKGQLAGAVLMLVTAALYIVIYIVTVVKIRHSHQLNRPPASIRLPPPQIQEQYEYVSPVFPFHQQQTANFERQQQLPQQHLAVEEEIECYNCHKMVALPSTATTRAKY